jgi:hypothetical protein
LKEKKKLVDVYLLQLNYKFNTDLDYYMRTCPPRQHKKPLNNNGMMKHMQRFRKIANTFLIPNRKHPVFKFWQEAKENGINWIDSGRRIIGQVFDRCFL